MKARPFKAADWFVPIKQGPNTDHPRMPGMFNGVYAIRLRSTKRVLYVGESHTDRLRLTIQAHLRMWIDRGQSREWYQRELVEVAWRRTASGEAAKRQETALILHYQPQDNTKGLDVDAPPPRRRSDFDDADAPDVTLIPAFDEIPF